MKPHIEIAEASPLWRSLPQADELVRRAIETSLEATRATVLDGAEVSIQLADDAKVRALNARWRRIDKATNVLSFPAVSPDRIAAAPMLGDIVMAFETVEREAAEENKSIADHISHLAVHGFLHLIGYDHQLEAEAERMETLETRILAKLGIADPYAATDPAGVGR